MKIRSDHPVSGATPAGRVSDAATRPGSSVPATSDAGGSSSNVTVTGLASRLSELESVLGNVSVVDAAQVGAIKQAIREGRFQVNSEVVAERLLASVRDLVLNRKL
jgi:negative regulator of flagellin synthesis FlgM